MKVDEILNLMTLQEQYSKDLVTGNPRIILSLLLARYIVHSRYSLLAGPHIVYSLCTLANIHSIICGVFSTLRPALY